MYIINYDNKIEYDLEKLSKIELIELKNLIDSDKNRIKVQLSNKNSIRNRYWRQRAISVMKIKGSQSQQIQAELSKRKLVSQNKLEQVFIQKSKELLDKDVYDKIMKETLEKIKQ
jgi:hypothetical protein